MSLDMTKVEVKHNGSAIRSRRPKKMLGTETSRRTVLIVAPKSLPPDYQFEVLVDGHTYTVTVPKGGVQQGEEFEIPHPEDMDDFDDGVASRGAGEEDSVALTAKPTEEEEEDYSTLTGSGKSQLDVQGGDDGDDNSGAVAQEKKPRQSKERDDLGAPYGRWRYPLCACCDVVTQATFWMGLFCIPILIAQLVTRMKLNWQGKKDTDLEISLSYNKIILTFLVVVALSNFTAVGFVLVIVYIVALLVYTGRNLRMALRKKYNIPSSLPEAMDDCCCMLFCCCCTSIQMSRQTHNDKEYPGSCCTPTGLDVDAPEITV